MTKEILDAPIKVVATQNIIDSCRNKLDRIYEELLRLESYKDLDSVSETELKIIMEIINAAIKKKKKAFSTRPKATLLLECILSKSILPQESNKYQTRRKKWKRNISIYQKK